MMELFSAGGLDLYGVFSLQLGPCKPVFQLEETFLN
jgi:hypothetical protein